MKRKPISGEPRSISDDDLCAQCHDCEYRPGEMSGCSENWPGLKDDDGYVQTCGKFRRRDLTNCRPQAFASFVQPAKVEGRNGAAKEQSTSGTAKTIVLTPTWAGVMPILIAAIQNGTSEGEQAARQELGRMAQVLDNMGGSLKRVKQYDAEMVAAERVPDGNDYNEVLRLLEIAG